MSLWPNRGETDPRPEQGADYEQLEPVPARNPAVREVRSVDSAGVDLGMPVLRTV